MSQRFTDKVVLITGGTRGIGLACAQAFRAEGASVAVTGRDRKQLATVATLLGPRALTLPADVADLSVLDGVIGEVTREFGRIDVLFANAGTSVRRTIDQITDSDWDCMMHTNLKGHYFLVQRALPLMPRGGSIVFTSSVAASRPRAGDSVYSASKVAVASLTKSLGAELVGRGIRVNAVSPGAIEAPRATRIPTSEDAARIFNTVVAARQPMKRWGTPQEVANAVLFLASADASYITGVTLPVDGGAGCF